MKPIEQTPDRTITPFDNLSLDDLMAREREARVAHDFIVAAIGARLMEECPIKIGFTYLITGKKMKGRRMLIVYKKVASDWFDSGEYRVRVEGPLMNPKSLCGDGFNIRYQTVLASNIDLSSEQICPEGAQRFPAHD